MTEELRNPSDRLAALAELGARLQWPLPRFRDPHLCAALARSIDALLANVARGHGVLDIAIGEHLDALERGGRVLRLGFVSGGSDPSRGPGRGGDVLGRTRADGSHRSRAQGGREASRREWA